MGKKDKNNADKLAKKDAKKAKQQAKGEKKALKSAGIDEEQDIESILKEIEQKAAAQADRTAPIVTVVPPPSRRAYCTFTPMPTGEVFMFGGEFYDGQNATVLNETFRWNIEKNEWRQIDSPVAPKPRCSHQAVAYKDWIYIFGGEFATAHQFHHFKDVWRFDIRTNRWEELKTTGVLPSARSGHRMINWRNYLVVFGGFYDTVKDTKYFGDVHFLSLQTLQWRKLEVPAFANSPQARSACQVCLSPKTDTMFVYGGFCKVKDTSRTVKGKILTDMWALNLKALGSLSHNITPVTCLQWEKVAKKGQAPPLRSGSSMVVHKSVALSFGGVFDEDDGGSGLRSVFYNDLYAFDMDRKRWFQLGLKTKKDAAAAKPAQKKKKAEGETGAGNQGEDGDSDNDSGSDSNGEEDNDDWTAALEAMGEGASIEQLFGYVEKDGRLVRVKVDMETNAQQQQQDKEDEEADKEAALIATMTPAEAKKYFHQKMLDEAQAAAREAAAAKQARKEEIRQLKAAQKAGTAPAAAAPAATAAGEDEWEDEDGDAPLLVEATTEVVAEAAAKGAAAVAAQLDAAADKKKKEKEEKATASMRQILTVDDEVPLPRINAQLLVKGNQLLIYGGVVECGDKQVTLDDCWSLDMNTRAKWTCLERGTIDAHPWNEEPDDDDSDGEDDDGEDWSDSESEDGEDEESEEESESESESEDEEEKRRKKKKSKKKGKNDSDDEDDKKKKKKKKKRVGDIRVRLAELQTQLEAAMGEAPLPNPKEGLRAYFDRTKEFWLSTETSIRTQGYQQEFEAEGKSADNAKAAADLAVSRLGAKELRRMAFERVEEKLESLNELITELNDMIEAQEEAEAEAENGGDSKPKKGGRR